MKISLIGMSGVGKTYWAKKLEKEGFTCYHCDDLIERQLRKKLRTLGEFGIKNVAKWMGQPYEKRYPINSKEYLDCEREVMGKILKEIKRLPKNAKIVIDTTGSVIYTGRKILEALPQLTKTVYLEVPRSGKSEMCKLYLSDPKPVIWGNLFVKKEGETYREAITRCYSKLLDYRFKKYKKCAGITLNSFKLKGSKYTVSEFLEMIG